MSKNQIKRSPTPKVGLTDIIIGKRIQQKKLCFSPYFYTTKLAQHTKNEYLCICEKGIAYQFKFNPIIPNRQFNQRMLFNFDFVKISSPSGMNDFGEFRDADKMILKLEELRKNGSLNATDHTVLMIGYEQNKTGVTKSMGSFRLSYLQDKWVVCLNMPTGTNRKK